MNDVSRLTGSSAERARNASAASAKLKTWTASHKRHTEPIENSSAPSRNKETSAPTAVSGKSKRERSHAATPMAVNPSAPSQARLGSRVHHPAVMLDPEAVRHGRVRGRYFRETSRRAVSTSFRSSRSS